MTAATPPARELSRGDRVSLVIFGVAAIAAAVWSVVAAALRSLDVLRNIDVEVLGVFAGTPASASLGPDGEAITIALDQAVLTVPSLSVVAQWELILQQIVMAGTIVTVVTCLFLLILRVLRGTVFSAASTRLVATAGIVALVGYGAHTFLGAMAANEAFFALSGGAFHNVVMSVNVLALFAIAFVAALLATVFVVGERLQRETEGLV